MYLLVFEIFAKTISKLPTEAILQLLDLECEMLERDAEIHRLYLPRDAYSIFCFRQFVRMVKFGEEMPFCPPLPPDHLEFYKETVVRLVHAKELPESAMKAFDDVFRS